MKRVVTLINQLATACASTAAFQAQADAASKVAEKYLGDNELLKKVRRCGDRWVQDPEPLTVTRNCIYHTRPDVTECVLDSDGAEGG